MDVTTLRIQLASATNVSLADALVDAYEELKARYFRGDFRPGQLEAGRFAEAAWRILQLKATGSFTLVGKTLPSVNDLLAICVNADANAVHESVRIHIPRALASVYNVRNRRDVGHIAADVDANSMDAEYVVSTCNWVLAEFVRLLHQCSPEEAQAYVQAIITRPVPLIQVFGNGPFVLRSDLSAKDEILVQLYHRASAGAIVNDLDSSMPTISRAVIRTRLSELERNHRYVRRVEGRAYITDRGAAYVEQKLFQG